MGYKFFNTLTKPMRTYRHVNQIKDSIVIVDWLNFFNQHQDNKSHVFRNKLYVFIECFKANNIDLIFVFDSKKIPSRERYRSIIFGMDMLDKLSVKLADDQVSYLYHKYQREGRKCYVYSQDSDFHFSRCRTITGLVVDDQKQEKRLGIFTYLYLPEWKDTGDNKDICQKHTLLAKISLQPEKMDLLGALLGLSTSHDLGIYCQQWIKMVAAMQEGPPFQFQHLINSINQLQAKIKKKTSSKEPINNITASDIRSQLFKLRCKPIFNQQKGTIEVSDPQYFQQHRQYLGISQQKMYQLLNVNSQHFFEALRKFDEQRKQFQKSTKYEKHLPITKQKVDASMRRYQQGKKIAQIQKKQMMQYQLNYTINLCSILNRGNLVEIKVLSDLRLSAVVVDSTSLFFDQLNPNYQICYTIRESLTQLNRIKQYLNKFIDVFQREKIRLIFLFDLASKCIEAPWMNLDKNQLQVQGQQQQQPMVISHQMLLIRARNILMKLIASRGAEIDYAADKIEQQAVHIYRRLEAKGERCAIYSQQHIYQIYRCRTVHSLHVQPDNEDYCRITHLFLPECSIQHQTKYLTELIEVSEFKQKLYLLAAFYMTNQQGKCGLILEAMTIMVYRLGQQPSYIPMTIKGLQGMIAQFKGSKYKYILTEEFRVNLTKHLFRLRFGPIFNKNSLKIEALEKQAVKKYEPDEQLFNQLNKTINEFVQAAQAKYQQRKVEYQMILKSNGNKI